MIFFHQSITIRITLNEMKEIDKLIALFPEKYENKSHFVRCAVIRLLRQHQKKGELSREYKTSGR